jgi:sigma-B regulation protein RsbU (phosphoserine phosphatase)
VSSLNEVMFEITSVDKFATLFYVCVNLKKNKLIYSNAGHFFPVIIRAGGWVEELDYSGLILGVQQEFEYDSLTLKIEPGDVIVVTTDGVIEAENDKGEFYGESRLHKFLLNRREGSADQIKEALVRDVEGFASASKVRDDMTILIVKRKS